MVCSVLVSRIMYYFCLIIFFCDFFCAFCIITIFWAHLSFFYASSFYFDWFVVFCSIFLFVFLILIEFWIVVLPSCFKWSLLLEIIIATMKRKGYQIKHKWIKDYLYFFKTTNNSIIKKNSSYQSLVFNSKLSVPI